MKQENKVSEFKVSEFTLPAYWASYLINGDCSGMEYNEIMEVDAWLSKHRDIGICVSCSDEQYFGTFNGLGCDLLDYAFIY